VLLPPSEVKLVSFAWNGCMLDSYPYVMIIWFIYVNDEIYIRMEEIVVYAYGICGFNINL